MKTPRNFFLLIVTISLVPCGNLQAAFDPSESFDKSFALNSEPASDLNVLFDNKTGWVGSDAAYSAVLGKDRILWLFGDTFVGKVKDGRRTDCVMVNNTIAIQTGRGKEAAIRFVTGRPKDGKATSLFMPDDGKGWLWPQAACRVGKQLYIFLPQIDRTGGGGAFGFKQVAQWLGVVDNPDDEPQNWRMTQHKIPFCDFSPGNEMSWGSAMLVDGKDVYIYGIKEKNKAFDRKKMIVASAPADQLTDFKSWHFRTATDWSEVATDAAPQADGLASEFSVTALPGGEGFIAVYTENGLGDKIMARVAEKPAGPWSPPSLLYTCPEMNKDKGVFCYSAKAHPWAAEGNELVITYCQNTWEFSKVFQDDAIYRPKFVRVRFARLLKK